MNDIRESQTLLEVFSSSGFHFNGQPIQKVMVILTLILPKAIDVNALHFFNAFEVNYRIMGVDSNALCNKKK